MKSLFAAIVIAVVVVTGGCMYTKEIDEVSERLLSINENVRTNISNSEYEKAKSETERMKEYFDGKNTLMAAMGDHNELDTIKINLSELEAYIDGREKTQALSKCMVLSFLFNHLPEGYHIKIENIL